MPYDKDYLPAVAVVVIAAGASTRLGRPKQLLQCGGKTLLRHVAEVAVASQCRKVIVVLGAYSERIRSEVNGLSVEIVANHRWVEGMSTSIQAGLKAVGEEIEAAVLMVGDQPLVSSALIDRLIESYHSTGRPIVACQYAGTLGVPTLFDRALFPELMSLQGDKGAKQVLHKYPEKVVAVPFPGGQMDIDTPEDYEQFHRDTKGLR